MIEVKAILRLWLFGCIDFRLPSSINPRNYAPPFARCSLRTNEANTSPANSSN